MLRSHTSFMKPPCLCLVWCLQIFPWETAPLFVLFIWHLARLNPNHVGKALVAIDAKEH